ncbi:MAG: hypothetical protein NC307_07900 [Roseburia sp.]|nr:hypothetical protein [Roseburia sp.]
MELETALIKIFSYSGTDGVSATEKAKAALTGNYFSGRGEGEKVINVQFNPTKLSFSSSKDGSREKEKVSVNSGKDDRMEHAPAQEIIDTLRLNIPLVFDQSLEKFQSVQPVVEGFMTMIEDSFVRRIAFCWGVLYYEGVLESISAEYELFDALGIPIRAKVDLDLKII